MIQPKDKLVTPKCENPSKFDLDGLALAIEEAKKGMAEGGEPIGAALVRACF
jgi:tRNA(Arg) A34 adenosine deaminase TadA